MLLMRLQVGVAGKWMAEGSAGAEFDVQSEVDRAGVGVIWLEWGGLLQPDD